MENRNLFIIEQWNIIEYMIDQIVKYLFNHSNITHQELCDGLNVQSQDIRAEFASLIKDEYLLKNRLDQRRLSVGISSVETFSLSPKGNEHYHKYIKDTKTKPDDININNADPTAKKIFISHAKKDKGIAEKLIDRLILPNFNVDKDKDIFFTSNRNTGIRSSLNWHNEIKNSIKVCKIFMVIITKDFRKSEMCLGEVGAAWVLDKSIHPLVVPPVQLNDFNDVIAVTQAEDLSIKDSIFSLVDSIEKDLLKHYNIHRTPNPAIYSDITAFHNYIQRVKNKFIHE